MCYPDELTLVGEVSQNVTADRTQIRRKRGGQEGNRNACKHGFYSAALSPAETRELWTITNQEGVDPELALIRVKLQSSLRYDPGNRRVVREASRLLVKWYSESYGLDSIERNYLKAVVDNFLEIARAPRPAELRSSQKQMADDETNRTYLSNLIGHPTYEKEHLNFRKHSDFHKTNHLRLRRVGPPAPATRENKRQIDETNRTSLNN